LEDESKELESMKAYKYFGAEESHNIEHKNEKETLKACVRRLRLILNTELSAKNKVLINGTLAIPVLRYRFAIVNWHQEEIQKLARKGKC
jgi:hypothetical protein